MFTKNSVEIGETSDADIEMIVNSKYISQLGNLCLAVQNAKANGDLEYEYNIGKTKLLWKYKSMMKHKNCFGF